MGYLQYKPCILNYVMTITIIFVSCRFAYEIILMTCFRFSVQIGQYDHWQGIRKKIYKMRGFWKTFDFLGLGFLEQMVAPHYSDVIMSAMASQIASLTIVYSTVCAGKSKNTSKLRVTGLYEGNLPVNGGFPSQRVSDAENISIWWRHHDSEE